MIEGLLYIPDFLSREEEMALVSEIDKNQWNTDISRRRQQYGAEYDIRSKGVENATKVPPIPVWLRPLIEKLSENIPLVDQAIINEYKPGQGIAAHIDSPVFGGVVISVSLLSDVSMSFQKEGITVEQILARRSALILSGEARSQWKHSIDKRYKDRIDGCLKSRGRRLSITLRSLRTK